jgi:class 3 adenylate cyclase
MAALCAQCGAVLPQAARYCPACAAEVMAADAPPARRVVTALFCDVVGSTELAERLDAEALRRLLSRYFDAVSRAVERHGGSIEKFIGDAVVAVFGLGGAREDDAIRAVRAALEARDAVHDLGIEAHGVWGVQFDVRIGVTTGEVVTGGASADGIVAGDTMNTAARLQAAAPVGGVLAGETTHALVREFVHAEPVAPLELKGKAELVSAYVVTSARPGVLGRPVRWATGMVGREAEERLLREELRKAVDLSRCRLVTLLGDAGVGKSRLVSEALERGGAISLAYGRCVSYGDGATYWPLAEVIRDIAGITDVETPDQVRAHLASLAAGEPDAGAIGEGVAAVLGVQGSHAHIEEAQRSVARLFAVASRSRPLVVIFDDVQWAQPGLLDLITRVVELVADAPVLMVCIGRPEFQDAHPEWPSDVTVSLGPLPDPDAAVLFAAMLSAAMPSDVRDAALTTAAGNPLFLEELAAMLVERGVPPDAHIEGASRGIAIPPTVHAVLAAHLDALPEVERSVLDRASIEGERFHVGSLIALGLDADTVAGAVASLRRRRLIRPVTASLSGVDAYAFHHLLVRDAAYAGLAKERRADWHEQFAAWAEHVSGERLSEVEEIVAYHLAQSVAYRRELGMTEAATAELARRAAVLYRSAADRAWLRGEFAAGAELVVPMTALLGEDDPHLAIALCDRAWNLYPGFGREAGARSAEAAIRVAAASGDPAVIVLADVIGRFAADLVGSAPFRIDDLDGVRRDAEALERRSPEVSVRLWMVIGALEGYWFQRHVHGAAASSRACEMAGRLEIGWIEAQARWHLSLHVLRGPGRLDEVIQRAADLSRGLGRAAQANFHSDMTHRRAQQGDADAAFEELELACTIGRDLWPIDQLYRSWLTGILMLTLGRPEEAIDPLRSALAGAQELDAGEAATIAGDLARALAMAGDGAAALVESDRCKAGMAPDVPVDEVTWRSVHGRALVAAGRADEALPLAHEILDLVDGLEDPAIAFEGRRDAAVMYAANERPDTARIVLERAAGESEERGAWGYAAQAREAIAALGTPAPVDRLS